MTISLDDIISAAVSLERGNNGGGPPKKTHCKNGHDMEEWGRQQYKTLDDGREVKNGRYCLKCHRDKQRTPGAAERPASQKPRRTPEEIAAAPSRRGKKQVRRVSGN